MTSLIDFFQKNEAARAGGVAVLLPAQQLNGNGKAAVQNKNRFRVKQKQIPSTKQKALPMQNTIGSKTAIKLPLFKIKI